ncbi:hypothetical protein HanRHA438_Chr03g0125741 [Helianthus annuus]|uniref:Transposase (Putative), gypsy type n=1 Tax=Helianthus annuus TaxID=4232 RepID=A0A9K3JGR8_HELAN|nr:hypothetical protein HanXRQr2_Chr03g0113831 [Helianthus annuus]KAJ0593256.1 hypothetical protein HanHA300_Chr03g0094991 [Helianthus annuus]KAJ0608266.1 hypothetical protein HanHA89_Chr03g0106671 [Helianthus annuus]KAJ0768332.1 hypothetical protein HanLR1_Chr03g0100061 [Helianthus annuus]KAJ0774092.1 hypothetical protein HanOQP8_Chr03g0107691 [Helianthus annuus]
MGARKDQSTSFSCLTQEEVEAFCLKWGIDPRFNPKAPGLEKSIDQCPKGSIALYCLARVLHFEILCRAAGYDPSLLSFRHFFRLVKNGNWFTFETSQVDVCLISSMVTILGSWKNCFFWVLESIVPFKMIWRHPDAVLNELEPSEDELENWFLKSIRACPSRLRLFPEPLLVLMGISTLWDKPDRDPVLIRDGQVMPALDFLKSDDTSDVVRGSRLCQHSKCEGLYEASCFKVVYLSFTRRKGVGQPSTSETIDLGDELDVEDTEVPDDGKKCELPLVAGKDANVVGKKVGGSKPSTKAIEGSSSVDPGEIYVPIWKVTISDTFKSPAIYEDVLNHFAPPAGRASSSSMVDDEMITNMIMASCNFCALIPEGISRFRKRMQEYEAFSKKREAMKASIATLKKDKEGFVEKELAWQKKLHELTQRHESEIGELKQQAEASVKEKDELEASLAQLAKGNKWLIEQGFQQVVTYLLYSSEFNSALGDVYSKLLIHGRHQGYTTGCDVGVAGSPKDKSPLF